MPIPQVTMHASRAGAEPRPRRGGRLLRIALLAALLACGTNSGLFAASAEFTCNDGIGGKVVCAIEREAALTRITCKRGLLFEVKWLCSVFPENQSVLCRTRSADQRIFSPEEFSDDANLCSSTCFCPLPKQ